MLSLDKSTTLEALIKGCEAGDSRAQRVLYERFSGRMLSICMRYMGRRDKAEDIMINAFMKIFDKIGSYKAEGSFEGWMRRVVVNDCLSEIRKERNMYLEVSVEEVSEEPDFDLLDGYLEAEDLLRMVEELPVGYRTVFNLYAIEGYSHKEIGEQLGISENTSKSQLSRARTLLQKCLKRMEIQVELKKQSHGK
jgi:RNA polymerase sigma-70 factor (ECF subfamily)